MSIFSRPATPPQTLSPLLPSEPQVAAWLNLKHRIRASSVYFRLLGLVATIFAIAFTATIAAASDLGGVLRLADRSV
jgi:hypothetical protein